MDSDNTYYTEIELAVTDNNFLTDLISEATKEHITIAEIKNHDNLDGITSKVLVKVHNREEINDFKNKLNKYKNMQVKE